MSRRFESDRGTTGVPPAILHLRSFCGGTFRSHVNLGVFQLGPGYLPLRSSSARIITAAVTLLGASILLTGLSVSGAATDVGTSARWKVPKPNIIERSIPYGQVRKHQMAAYSKRHYGQREWRLRQPRQIVEHMAAAPTVDSIFSIFARNRPDPELGELPGVLHAFRHLGIGPNRPDGRTGGAWHRHVVGLNRVAIGIEHVGYRDGDLLGNRRQRRSSIRLTRWLRCRFDIGIRDVIGHNESLSSRFHYERIKSLKNQTHGDMRRSSMRKYRKRLHPPALPAPIGERRRRTKRLLCPVDDRPTH